MTDFLYLIYSSYIHTYVRVYIGICSLYIIFAFEYFFDIILSVYSEVFRTLHSWLPCKLPCIAAMVSMMPLFMSSAESGPGWSGARSTEDVLISLCPSTWDLFPFSNLTPVLQVQIASFLSHVILFNSVFSHLQSSTCLEGRQC